MGCVFLFVLGFSNEHGVVRDIVDGRDTVIVARAHRGSFMMFIGRITVAMDEAAERLHAEDPDVFDAAKAYRRQMMLQSALFDPCFRQSSNATRMSGRIPSWNPKGRTPRTNQFGFLVFPIWIAFFFFAAYPIFALFRGPMRRRRRRLRNECVHCGYSLIGLVEPRCPECGGANELQTGENASIEEPIADETLQEQNERTS